MLKTKQMLILAGAGLWIAVAGWGMKGLTDYSFAPGEPAVAPRRWPAESSLPFAPGKFTFVAALHPECPCSRATVAQLEHILDRTSGRLSVVVLFDARNTELSESDSALLARVRAMPDVRIINDGDGAEMDRFQFRTSGEIRLYQPDGTLVFEGGITASRGHVGDNPGQTAVVAAIQRGASAATPVRTPVFGCSLRCE